MRLGILIGRADVVELVDTLDSGSSGRKPVGVRVSPSAPCFYGGVAQLVRATGSYPVGRRFESARRYQLCLRIPSDASCALWMEYTPFRELNMTHRAESTTDFEIYANA